MFPPLRRGLSNEKVGVIMGFDIRKIDTKAAAERGLTFELMWEDQPVGINITVVGAGSAAYKKHKAIVDGKEANAEKRGKKLTADEREMLYATLAANCTTGWEGMELDGKLLEFSVENAIAVYTEFPVIATQVITKIYSIAEMVGNVEIGQN